MCEMHSKSRRKPTHFAEMSQKYNLDGMKPLNHKSLIKYTLMGIALECMFLG